MGIENLTPAEGSTSNRKRVGRGQGSGTGKTAARGQKGQKSRSGYKRKRNFDDKNNIQRSKRRIRFSF